MNKISDKDRNISSEYYFFSHYILKLSFQRFSCLDVHIVQSNIKEIKATYTFSLYIYFIAYIVHGTMDGSWLHLDKRIGDDSPNTSASHGDKNQLFEVHDIGRDVVLGFI